MKRALLELIGLRPLLVGLAVLCGALAGAQTNTNPPAPFALGTYELNLPVLLLEAKESIATDQKASLTLRMLSPKGVISGQTNVIQGTSRIHGGTSRSYPKKSYNLALTNAVPLLDFRPSAHWILNAAYIDRSLMRHKLGYDLFRSLSAPGAPRFASGSRFVEVYLNQDYQGVYLLMERVDRHLLGWHGYNSNDVNHACLYKAVDHPANFSAPGHAGYEQREPNAEIKPYWEPMDAFNQFVSTAPREAFEHPQTGIGSRLDLDNAMDFYLLVLLNSNSDGITKNYFLGRDGYATNTPAPLFFFAPWDYDGTFGRDWDSSAMPPNDWLSNHLFDRLLENAAFRQRFGVRWKHLRDHQFSAGAVQALIDENARTLGDAASRNATRWPGNQGPYHDRITWAEDVAQMKTWVVARIQYLDEEIRRLTASPK
ncbi:MAG: CotH kinase family protein [Verrucomicrobiota bacterium]